MQRRMLVSAALLGVLTLSGCGESSAPAGNASDAAPAQAPQTVYRWKMVTTWPKNFPGLGTAPERFAERLRAMSNGRLDITVYAAGELVPATEVLDAVSRKTAEMGHGAGYYWKGKIPAAQFFSTVPFGLTAQEYNGWMFYGGGLELYREAYAPFGVVPWPGGNTGVQMGGWFNKEINNLDDLSGLKMRIPGIGGDVLQKAGATSVNLPGGEIFGALQAGTIDATEWVGPYNDLAFGLHRAARFYYYPGWHEPGTAMELIVNSEALAGLPQDLQAMIDIAAREMNADVLAEFTARNSDALQDMRDKHQVDIRPFPEPVLARLNELSEQVVSELAAADPMAGKAYASYKAFRDRARPYTAMSEQAILNARP